MTDQEAPPLIGSYLSVEQRQKLGAWLDSHWTNWDCPFHGDTTWTVGELIGDLTGHVPVGGPSPNQAYPFIPLICEVCGYSVLINVLKVGLVSPQMPPPPTPAEVS